MNFVANYCPEEGTGPRLAVDYLRAHPGVEVSSADLAVLMRVEIKNVSGTLTRAVSSGLIAKRREGRACYYWVDGTTAAAHLGADLQQQADPNAIARMAVIKLKGAVLSSVVLAEQCHTTPEVIDAALSSLVDEHKLTRISVLRGGVEMFDYRYSAAWVPKEADFAFNAPAHVPHPALSPVAPPKPRPAPAPTSAPVKPIQPRDALEAGAELGRKMGIPDSKLADAAKALGWQIGKVTGLDGATLEASQSTDTLPNIFEADDMVMAINSRGEFVIDLGDGDLVKFPPAQALCLKRFLDNTSVLEELSAQGAV